VRLPSIEKGTYQPSYEGSLNRSVALRPTQDPTLKITKAKRVGGMAQVVEHLPKQAQDPEFKPRITTKKKKRQRILR
jgi:hypothetical protein